VEYLLKHLYVYIGVQSSAGCVLKDLRRGSPIGMWPTGSVKHDVRVN
jgi:hypothetical protein